MHLNIQLALDDFGDAPFHVMALHVVKLLAETLATYPETGEELIRRIEQNPELPRPSPEHGYILTESVERGTDNVVFRVALVAEGNGQPMLRTFVLGAEAMEKICETNSEHFP